MCTNLLDRIKEKCIEGNVPIISNNTWEYINKILNTHKPINCIEIGSAIGYSLLKTANIINQRGGNIIGFEISYPSYKNGLSNINKSNLYNIKLYNFDFKQLSLNRLLLGTIDYVFIDAMKKEYIDYFHIILPFLKKNSVIIFDDVIKFKNRINSLYIFFEKNQIKYKIIKLDEDDGIIEIIFQ